MWKLGLRLALAFRECGGALVGALINQPKLLDGACGREPLALNAAARPYFSRGGAGGGAAPPAINKPKIMIWGGQPFK